MEEESEGEREHGIKFWSDGGWTSEREGRKKR